MLTDEQLRTALYKRFHGSTALAGIAPKTRNKLAKEMACEALGYPIPRTFPRTRPRFLLDNFNISVQLSNNWQPTNQESLEPTCRYAFVILGANEVVHDVVVIRGEELAKYNKTGVATLKRQASFAEYSEPGHVVIGTDTAFLSAWIAAAQPTGSATASGAAAMPDAGLLPIGALGAKLRAMVGTTIHDHGANQDRRRGEALHRAACTALGYASHCETGQHPDIPNQLLEVKLQTSPTVDLGLVDPSSTAPIGPPFPAVFRHADARYAVFGGVQETADTVRIASLVVTSGESFFTHIRRMGGLGVNSKHQFKLPAAWWA